MIPPNVLEGKPLDIEPSPGWHTSCGDKKPRLGGPETGPVKFGGRKGARWALPEITLHETDDRTKDPARGRADRKYKFWNANADEVNGEPRSIGHIKIGTFEPSG